MYSVVQLSLRSVNVLIVDSEARLLGVKAVLYLVNVVSLCIQAVAMRDTLARALYGALFDWIVDQVELILL